MFLREAKLKIFQKFPLIRLILSSLSLIFLATSAYTINISNFLMSSSLGPKLDDILNATLWNLVIFLVLLIFFFKDIRGWAYLLPKFKIRKSKMIFNFFLKYPAMVGVCYFTVILMLAASTWFLTGSRQIAWELDYRAFVLTVILVPIVEELLFRGLVTNLFFKISGSSWAAYFSVLCFTALHGVGSPADVFTLNIALPLGPLLLGAACELLRFFGFSLIAPVALHMAANATIFIFSVLDSRWLDWLSVFYI